MDGFVNSQASTQGLRETQEIASQFALDDTELDRVWGRLFSLKDNVSACNLSNLAYTFGRGDVDYRFSKDNADVSLLPAISKLHFRITREVKSHDESVVVLEDHSCNGTFVNGKAVGRGKKVVLQNNDEIALAHAKRKVFVFHDIFQNDNSYPPQLTQLYTMTKVLGTGNFGEVRLAYRQGTLEKCAVKIIKKKGSQMLYNNITQINNEIQLLQSVDHPCIIKLLDIIDTDDKIYLVMELAEGGELFDRLTAYKRLPEPTTKFYFFQLVRAVQYLHKKKITHRDIKPENILFSSDEEFTRVKLTDFGLSKFAADASQMTTFCGTPTYIAPELLAFGKLSYTSKVDMWSLGVVLFVCLVGYPPFYADDDGTLRYRIKNAIFSFGHRFWKDVSDDAKDLITKLLVSDPIHRYDIEQVLSHPWLQDESMKRRALDLMNDDLMVALNNKKRALETEEEEVELSPNAKTPKIQQGPGTRA